jgi:hypothetical protein
MDLFSAKFSRREEPDSSPQNGSLMCKNDSKQAGF